MITLFENITQQLTKLEKETLVPLVLKALEISSESYKLKGWAITNYLHQCGYSVSEPRLRKMINYIRVTNMAKPKVVIGASSGYFLTDKIDVVEKQIESLLGRIDAIKAAVDTIKAQRENLKHSR